MNEGQTVKIINDALQTPKQMATAEGSVTERSATELVELVKERERQQSSRIPAPWGMRTAKLSPNRNFG